MKTTTPTELQNLLATQPDLSILDVRTPVEYPEVHDFVGAELIFAGVSAWCGMGLLLAKLPWNTRKPA